LNQTDTIEASCWRNLWFVREGRFYHGLLRFRSEREATRAGEPLDGFGESRRGPDAERLHRAALGRNAPHPNAVGVPGHSPPFTHKVWG
jgi:hypothetical protein